jgi:hypothetical protein
LITDIPTRSGTSRRQGMPHKTAAHRGKTQCPRSRRNCVAPDTATSHEDTSPDRRQPSRARAYPPRSHYKLSLYPSNNIPPRVIPGGYLSCSSPNVGRPPAHCPGGGGERDRTDDLLLAKQALSQLSYTPDQRSEIRIQRSASSDLRSVSSDLWHWWAREDLNLRPHAYQARALTS